MAVRLRTPLMACLLSALAACGDGDSRTIAVPTTTSTAAASPSDASPPVATSVPAPGPGCTVGNQSPPSGFTRTDDAPTDFDGDGKPDGVYQDGSDLFVAPTSGQGARLDVPTAKPIRRLGGIDPEADGRQEMFVAYSGVDAEFVVVATFASCRVVLVTNAQGRPYEFKVVNRPDRGDGVGCADANGDGRRDLVGLHYERQGPTVNWSRTIVRLESGRAVNGAVDHGKFVSPADDAAIALLDQVTCGDQATFRDQQPGSVSRSR